MRNVVEWKSKRGVINLSILRGYGDRVPMGLKQKVPMFLRESRDRLKVAVKIIRGGGRVLFRQKAAGGTRVF